MVVHWIMQIQANQDPRHQLMMSWKGFGVLLSNTDTVPEERLATTRSGLPSALTSVATIQTGAPPTSKVKGVANSPSPRLISTEIVPEAALATAKMYTVNV